MTETQVRHECYTNDTSAARVKNFDFDNDTNKNIFSHPYIYYMASERLQGEWKYRVPMPNAFRKSTTKTELFNGQSHIKNLYTTL